LLCSHHFCYSSHTIFVIVHTIFVIVHTIFVIVGVKKTSSTKGSQRTENNVKHLKQKIVKQQQQEKTADAKSKIRIKLFFKKQIKSKVELADK
jgi:signal transduction histidine kinase